MFWGLHSLSVMSIMYMKVVNLFEETPQIFTFCGRGPRSSLRILRPGLAISEMAVSQLPGVPSAVWTVKKTLTMNSMLLSSFLLRMRLLFSLLEKL
ncbi:putative WD40/YVTN repeat-like-containing domain superfamily [Helianthus anomalus]